MKNAALRFAVNGLPVSDHEFRLKAKFARDLAMDGTLSADVTLSLNLPPDFPPTLQGCDCEQEGHPDRERHASDCAALVPVHP